MEAEHKVVAFTTRDFIARIRAELDRNGHSDIPVKRAWIDEGTPGERFLLNVPVGAELVAPLRPRGLLTDIRTGAEMDLNVRDFATALANLRPATRMLERYVCAVRRAAVREIEAARADGLDVALETVQLKPAYAWHLNCASWRDAASALAADVRVRHTSFSLRPDVSSHWVDRPEYVAEELAELMREQRERQDRIAELEQLGADLELDVVTLDLLAAHGIPVEETLRTVLRDGRATFKLTHCGHDTELSLSSFDGRVRSFIILEEAIWNGRCLWFRGEGMKTGNDDLVGRCLGLDVSHPAFAGRPITAVMPGVTDEISFDQSEVFLFDADTGLVRGDLRLAA